MKKIGKIFNSMGAWAIYLLITVYSCAIYDQEKNSKNYKILVTFCDDRPDRVVILSFTKKPKQYELNSFIYTQDLALSSFFGLKNVCEVKLIE